MIPRSARCVLLLAVVTSSGAAQHPQLVFSAAPSVWYDAEGDWAHPSPNGRIAIYGGWSAPRIIDLITGTATSIEPRPDIRSVTDAAFGPRGEIVLQGTVGGTDGWFAREHGAATRLPIPATATPRWSPDGSRIAFAHIGESDTLFVGPLTGPRAIHTAGVVTGFEWYQDGSALLMLVMAPSGSSFLARLDLASGRQTILAHDLDAPTYSTPIAITVDGRRAYLPLAGQDAPIAEQRHLPLAKRPMGIFEVDLGTGARHPARALPAEGDDIGPALAAGYLYWTHTATDVSVVTLSAASGVAHVVAHDAMVPTWRPDARQIGFAYGNWRWVDWAINWDAGVVDVDTTGRATGALRPIITGYHEDFPPVWSPKGRWIAFHSHRAPTPVPTYLALGASDDIWLRRIGAPARDPSEIRLTDFGLEAGSPTWSRDGTTLVFHSWQKGGRSSVSFPFFVSIDTATGRVLAHGRVALPKEIQNGARLDWSPTSDELAIEERLGNGHHALWILPVNPHALRTASPSPARKLAEYPLDSDGGVSWTPDGKHLVYAALAEGRLQLFEISVTGGVPRQLTHDAGNVFLPSVSPDGRLIAATRIVHRKEVWRMRVH